MVNKYVGIFLAALLFLLVVAFLFGWPLMILWNWLVPAIFGLPTITFWQAIGLNLLSGILFGKTYTPNSKNNG